jgi:signal transduction histidine kinase/response regulator RpfG family c-di-GMP phosphodiesterase
MIKRPEQKLSRYLILIFYSAIMIALIFYAWIEQSETAHGENNPLYRNLRECPAYIKRGFDPADLQKIPDESDGWSRFQSPRRRIIDSELELPKRKFLSPWENDIEEFTINILLEMDSGTIAFLNGNILTVPGFFFAGIGENWEVYFNGKLIRSEAHLDEKGVIRERRTWYDVYFPFDSSLILAGTNILTLRILGDPTYPGTGLFYRTAPIYMDDYNVIEGRQFHFLNTVLYAIFAFTGIYYLVLYFSVKKNSEVFNLYFGIFSILLFIYIVSRQKWIYSLIPNSDITTRMEYGSLMLAIPLFGIFFENLGMGKTSKASKCYLILCFLICLTQIFFCNQYGEEIILIWDLTAFLYITYILGYYIIYFFFWKRQKRKIHEGAGGADPDLHIGGVLIGMLLSYLCGLFDIVDALFFRISIRLFTYSIFAVHIGMVFILSQRFSGMYKRLEQSNTMLEIAVQERTIELEKQTRIAINASNAKSEFLAAMSHEIRTPLNAVIGMSEIELRKNLPESSRDNIVQIHQSGSSLLGIINDILDISKIEAGGFELVPMEYETASLLSDTVNLNRVRIASKSIVFVLEIDGNFPRKLNGDELKIKQVLNNILSNSIKYTMEGTVTLSVSWERAIKKNEALIRFAVRDTGVGIRKEDIKKLFTSYTQLDVKANRKIEGTGLGLEISKKLVDMMSGKITVESEYGKGSVFTVEIIQGIADYIPIGEETAEKLKNFSYIQERKGEDINRSWMPYCKVLVVDDLPVNLQIARGLLEPYGLKVDSAESGQKAIELVKLTASQGRDYDIVFMDHMMPEMDGIEATAAIRLWEKERQEKDTGKLRKQIPIIALTANAVVGMREMFIEKGFNDFLSKPIDVYKLDEMLVRWIPEEKRGQGTEKLEDGKKLVILVDDSPANLRLGKDILSQKYRVATSPSAKKLFNLLENNTPALILMDIDMPEMNGYDAFNILKSKAQTKDIPVIFLAENSQDVEKSRVMGAADCVLKPFDPLALLAGVEKYI